MQSAPSLFLLVTSYLCVCVFALQKGAWPHDTVLHDIFSGLTRSRRVHAQCLVVPSAGRLLGVGVSALCVCGRGFAALYPVVELCSHTLAVLLGALLPVATRPLLVCSEDNPHDGGQYLRVHTHHYTRRWRARAPQPLPRPQPQQRPLLPPVWALQRAATRGRRHHVCRYCRCRIGRCVRVWCCCRVYVHAGSFVLWTGYRGGE